MTHDTVSITRDDRGVATLWLDREEKHNALSAQMIRETGDAIEEELRGLDGLDADPAELERVEERLFALRGLARKHSVLPDDLGNHAAALRERLEALDAGRPDAWEAVSAAKVRMGKAARFVGGQGVQLHGGVGMTDAFDIGLFMKRARPAAQLFGDERFHAERFATLGGY